MMRTRINVIESAKPMKRIVIASLSICLFAYNLSADTKPIRVSVAVHCSSRDEAQMRSAVSHEFRRLDGVSVTDTQPALKVTCAIMQLLPTPDSPVTGYAASVATTTIDDRLIGLFVYTAGTVDGLAHRIAVAVDGDAIEPMRRAAQPSRSP